MKAEKQDKNVDGKISPFCLETSEKENNPLKIKEKRTLLQNTLKCV